ncbi:MAG: SBBP repeat-containing protein, partial [Candidatus Jordarchaeaceae archaeon]
MDAWITRKGVLYDFFQLREVKSSKQDDKLLGHNPKDETKEFERYGHVVRVNNAGASVMCKPVGLKKKQGYYNYFIGNDPKKWASFVGLYEEVRVEGIYSGIDQRWYFDGNSIRYDYIVHPGADYRQIKLSFEGEYNVFIKDNELYFTTRFGEVKQAELLVYQEENGVKEVLQSKWVERGGKISFEIEDYNPEKAIIIDPLVYSTYIGGSQDDVVYSIAIDANGNAYVAGYTYSTDYPTTSGAYDQTYNNYQDVFVTKLNSTGSSLLYSTFIGGSYDDVGYSIAIDANGNAYVTGGTRSTYFPPTNGASDQTHNGYSDVFVT